MGIMDEIHKHSQKIVETGKEIEYEISGLRNFLGRSNTTEPSYQPTKPQNSLPLSTSQNPLIAPATQTDLEAMRYEGRIGNWRERFPELKVHKKGNPDKNSWVYKAVDSKTGRNVAIKELTGSFNPDDIQGSRSSEKELESLVGTYSMLHHSGLVQVLGYYWENNGKGIMVPHVVMEFVDGEPISEHIKKKYSPSQEDLLTLLFGLGGVIEYMHTSRSQPVHHRDIKPANIMDVNGDSPYPFKLVDLTESKVGDATMSGSVLGSLGYRPPEQQWGEVNSTTDWYGLFRTLEECIMLENFGKKDLSRVTAPNVPEKLITAIRKGTNLKIDERYGSLIEIARDLGYNIERAPQTREELEAILGHRSLAPRVEARVQEQPKPEIKRQENSNLPIKVEENDALVIIDGNSFVKKSDVYETARHIQTLATNPEFPLAYLQHAAQTEHSILQDAVQGKSLESLAREKKPRKMDFRKSVRESPLLPSYNREAYQEAKHAHLQRRKDICDVLGVGEDDFVNIGAVAGIIGGYGGAFATIPFLKYLGVVPMPQKYAVIVGVVDFFGSLALGAITGSKIGQYVAKRKLIKRAREMDTWIYQARVAQGLETRGEDVELSWEEEKKIDAVTNKVALGSGLGALGLSTAGYVLGSYSVPEAFALQFSSLPLAWGLRKGLQKYLTNRALRRKRLEAGLPSEMPKQEMREYARIEIKDIPTGPITRQIDEEMKEHLGVKKKLLRRRFFREGVNIDYRRTDRSEETLHPYTLSFLSDYSLVLRATSEEKASDVIETIREKYPRAEIFYPNTRKLTPVSETGTTGNLSTNRKVGGGIEYN